MPRSALLVGAPLPPTRSRDTAKRSPPRKAIRPPATDGCDHATEGGREGEAALAEGEVEAHDGAVGEVVVDPGALVLDDDVAVENVADEGPGVEIDLTASLTPGAIVAFNLASGSR